MLEFQAAENGNIEAVTRTPEPSRDSAHSYVSWGEEARTSQMRQALISQARVIVELQREVAKLRLIEDLLESRS